jgi:hypothetical protein
MTSAPFPQVGVRSLIDTVFSHDDGRRSRMIGAPKTTPGRRFRRLAACDVGSALACGVRRSLSDRSVAK